MKKAFLGLVMVFACFSSVAHAETICGEISQSEGRFYIQMGNASAQLMANDTWFFKPKTKLAQSIGQNVCLEGDWYNDYVFEVLRVN